VKLVHLTTVDLSLRFLLRDQLRAYREAGFEVIGMSAPGPWIRDLQDDGLAHVAVPALVRRVHPLADARALAQLIRVLRRVAPTILHTHTPKAGVLGRLAARVAGVPIVVNTVHGFYALEGSRARRRFYLWLERLAARASDFELCQSREDLEMLRRLGVLDPARSAYLGNGVDLGRFDPALWDRRAVRAQLGIPPEAVVVGTVGRLVWEKGYREFFTAAEALRLEHPALVWLAVGPAEAEKADGIPAAVLDDLQRRGVIRFLGMRTDMPALYAAMDVFVLASYREGFPRSAVEAAALGLPLVLTDIRGCREVVAEGGNGFLVPPHDSAALQARIRQLIGDPRLRTRFAGESRARALREFDERRIIATTLDLYRRLLREWQGGWAGAHQESEARG